MHDDIETAARVNLVRVLETEIEPEHLALDADMVQSYGLTSLNKVLFLTSICKQTSVDLFNFTEHDLARMNTLQDVIDGLARHANGGLTR